MSLKNHFTYIRVIAIGMVVLLHVAAPVRDQLETMNVWNWLVGAYFDAVGRAGVPIFVMISGALLLPKDEAIGVFYRKRLTRMLLPFFFWGLFYALYSQWQVHGAISLWQGIVRVFEDPSYYHLWYLYMILGLYLITPFLRVLVKYLEKKQLEILLLLFLVFRVALPHFSEQVHIWFQLDFSLDVKLPWDIYLGYFILGYYLEQHVTKLKPAKHYFTFFFAISFVLVCCSYVIYRKEGTYNPLFVLNESPLVLLQGICIFLGLKAWTIKGERKPSKLLVLISTLSFGIYLIHPFLLDVLDRSYLGFQLNAKRMDTILSIPSLYLVIFPASLLCCWLIYQVPYVKRIVS